MTTRLRWYSAGALSALVFAVYRITLSPATSMWDAGEYIATAKSMGIPHPPGNPMYTLIAHAFGLIPLSASYDIRINTLAALASAITAGFWFLVAERVLREKIEGTAARIMAAAGASLFGAGPP